MSPDSPNARTGPAPRPVPPETSAYRRLPELVDVEGDSYVFVALLERLSRDEASNWLMQTLRVDPSDGDDDELAVTVTERCHTDARTVPVAFDDQYTLAVPIDDADRPLRVESIGDALARQYVVCEGCGHHLSARILDDEVAIFTPDQWCECGTETFSGERTSRCSTPEKGRVD